MGDCVRWAAVRVEIALQDAYTTADGARGSTAPMRSPLVYDLAEYMAMMFARVCMHLEAGGTFTETPFKPTDPGGPGDAFAASFVFLEQSLQHLLEELSDAPDAVSAEELRVLKALAHTNVEAVTAAASQDEGAAIFSAGHSDFCNAARVLRSLCSP